MRLEIFEVRDECGGFGGEDKCTNCLACGREELELLDDPGENPVGNGGAGKDDARCERDDYDTRLDAAATDEVRIVCRKLRIWGGIAYEGNIKKNCQSGWRV